MQARLPSTGALQPGKAWLVGKHATAGSGVQDTVRCGMHLCRGSHHVQEVAGVVKVVAGVNDGLPCMHEPLGCAADWMA